MFHQNEDKSIKRKNRGEASEKELQEFIKLSYEGLIFLLKSAKPPERTSAAKILGRKKFENAIPDLCEALKNEKSLYSRIAISEALGEIGVSALHELVKLLGKIGDNQHKKLPDKPFEKKSYPLPRDIVARTITKIGEKALEFMIKSIPKLHKESLSEAIDAIGFISYYSGNQTAFETIKMLIHQFNDNDLILWKLIRSLQAFPNKESIEILEYYKLNHVKKTLVLEAERSIAQIRVKNIATK